LVWLKNILSPKLPVKNVSSPRCTNTPESGPGWFYGAPMGFTEPGFNSSRKSESIDRSTLKMLGLKIPKPHGIDIFTHMDSRFLRVNDV